MMFDSEEIENDLRKHWVDTSYAENRTEKKKNKTRAGIVYKCLDYAKVSVIKANETGVVRDSKTKEIVFIVWWCKVRHLRAGQCVRGQTDSRRVYSIDSIIPAYHVQAEQNSR